MIVLAVLQYRWSNQVSEATTLRLSDSLEMSMVNWQAELFRHFSQICLMLGVNSEPELASDQKELGRSLERWRREAPYPGLVANLYVVALDDSTASHALRFDFASDRFQSVERPRDLPAFRADFDPAVPGGHIYPRGPLAEWRFDPQVFALYHRLYLQDHGRQSVEWVVIALDKGVLQNRILPDLAHRYFQGTDGLDFQVAVVGGNPRQVIYSSDSGFGYDSIADADGTMDLFGRLRDGSHASPVSLFRKTSLGGSLVPAVGGSWFPLFSDQPADDDWQLFVRHRRGGPLGAFAAEMRRRDLAISFGVLFLLVLSTAALILASHRAQRLAQLQMDFVAMVSHELRTPITVIRAAADNLSAGVVHGKEQVKQYSSMIGAQSRQLSELVEQILLFAAAREKRQQHAFRMLRVSQIIDAASANTSDLVRAAEFTTETKIEPNLPLVIGDLAALSQCLQNLITNALKYGGESKWVGIEVRSKPDGTGGRNVEIRVSDRGIGIESADLPHIFEPFYRSASVAAAQIHGTGLGLALAKSIAEAMHGRLTVVSSVGSGSTFALELPCVEPPTEEDGAVMYPSSFAPQRPVSEEDIPLN
jgi:signal transduction histidine kinase